MAYYSLEPWGTDIDDDRFGTVAAAVANANRNPKKQPKPFTAADFFPGRDVEPIEDDIETSGAKWRAFVQDFQKRG